VAASLLPAMRIGRRLSVEGTVSPRVLGAIPAIEGVMSSWFSRVDSIEVSAQPAPEPRGTGVACFFSGGVDSFYSVLSHLDEITALVFVHGFDIQPRNLELRARISESLRNAASQLGKPLIEVETNLRAFADRFAMWSEEYHGSALASVALLLSPQFARFYIPASFPPSYSAPWGSHKDLDPLWSSDATEVIHDGVASRVDKTRLIARSDVALQWLRVCWENRAGKYNCGRCEKCIRTMENLQVVGALERCATFGNRLDMNAVAHLPIPDPCARVFIEENLEAAREAGQLELARAIASSLKRKRGGFVDRVRKGDLRYRAAMRIQRSLGRSPVYSWELSDSPLST
jgi:7-cyano-7-deazaguanine synthase in queuosine biosynthesis